MLRRNYRYSNDNDDAGDADDVDDKNKSMMMKIIVKLSSSSSLPSTEIKNCRKILNLF